MDEVPRSFLTPFLRELGGRTASCRCWSWRVGKAARLVGPVFERRSIAVRPGKAVRSETPGRTLGGTVREHDQPRLHMRLCLWSGLIFALAIPTASRAQDPAALDAQAANDPIELAARHVQVWETAGERWAILSGEAAVLQAGDGLRAHAAVVRIIEVPMEDGKGYQAEIYAEGEVRISGQGGRPRPQVRTVLLTRKQVQLRAYRENGLTQWKEPPRDLLILRRSGFVSPEPAATRSKPATARPEPAAAPSVLAAAPQAQILAPAIPGSASRVETARNGPTAPQPPDLPPLEPVPPPSSPKKDPQLRLAQFEQRPCGHPGSGNRPSHARRAG